LPVLGFLPFLADLALTLNFPNPDSKTSSPFSRLDLTIWRMVYGLISQSYLVETPTGYHIFIAFDILSV
jgi:hypothetical protein